MMDIDEALATFEALDPRDQLGPAYRKYFDKHGIVPEKRDPKHTAHSIGFSEKEQKWYGWSHRAIYGFGIGSKVKRGDCGYAPVDAADFLSETLGFWLGDENHENTWAEHAMEDGRRGIQVFWKYNSKAPNKSLHGLTGGVFCPYPDAFGKGEWTAKTLDDAKQMAIDFAEGVA